MILVTLSHFTRYKIIVNLTLGHPPSTIENYSENFLCIPWSVVHNDKKWLFMFFIAIAPIVWVLGLAGNSLGLKMALKEKYSPNVLLTQALYLVNILNCLVMLMYPILDLIGELKFAKFWMKIYWNKYMADYHFPMAKSLVSFSFGIYVILALSQLIGTAFPFKYKNWFRNKNIMYMLVFNLVYVVVWCIPIKWWFVIEARINVCGLDPFFIVYYYKFNHISKKQILSWTIYEVSREIFTKFIPVLTIFLVKFWTNKKNKSMLAQRINRSSISNLNQLPSSSKFPFFCRKSRVSDISIRPDKNIDRRGFESSKMASTVQDPKLYARLKDYKAEKRMIAIMGVEFIVFLFPVSVFLIFRNFFIGKLMDHDIDIAFAICTILEYLYISLTFYLNLIFNPSYRRRFINETHRVFRCIEKKEAN
ncbi:unnamed protein product [Gordionus sp. m RMFG-2023]